MKFIFYICRFIFVGSLTLAPCYGLTNTTQIVFSNPFPEEQQPDELFSSYFARITRGGTFPGIYLKAPDQFAEQFRPYSRKSFWMGPLEKTQQELTRHHFDLWGDVYRSDYPQKFLKFSAHWEQTVFTTCGTKIDVNQLPFPNWPTCLRESFITEVLFDQASAFYLAKLYDLEVSDVRLRVEIFILPQQDFAQKLKEAGWEGPIYFRAATMPNPNRNSDRWILLNDDFLKQYTGFDSALLQMLELAGIANHELSHVMQDFRGQRTGNDVQVRNAEQLLLIEGQAEYLAEKSFEQLGLFYKLFAREQAVEVVNREGNSQNGLLFPYTVGLPFVTTLYSQETSLLVTDDILRILGDQNTLENYLKTKNP